jgi:hypothetical protein
MTIKTEFFLLLALLSGSLTLLYRSRKSRAWGIACFVLADLSAILLLAHHLADQMTCESINEAVLYHIRYGLRHAAPGAYPEPVVTGLLVLLVSVLVFGCFAFWPRLRSGKTGLVIALMLVWAGLLLNPVPRYLSFHSENMTPNGI